MPTSENSAGIVAIRKPGLAFGVVRELMIHKKACAAGYLMRGKVKMDAMESSVGLTIIDAP